MEVTKRIERLRSLMEKRGIDAYLIPTSDFHESEYVGDYFKCREYMTGFTGSAGTAVVTKTEVRLWTDGRYFVQAAKELEGSGIILEKMGQPEVPTVEEYLEQAMPEKGVLGFDGRVVNCGMGETLAEMLEEKKVTFSFEEDLVGMIWEDRPELSSQPVWILEEAYAGKPAAEKIAELRDEMKKAKATLHILTTLDDIVWLLNIRGNDVPCNPVVLSYAAVTQSEVILFIQEQVLNHEVRSYLSNLGAAVRPYEEVYEFVKSCRNQSVLLEKGKTNFAVCNLLDSSNRVIDSMNPTVMAKAVKNPVEIANMKKAHIKDGVAMTKFICWLKKNIGVIPMDEVSVSDYLEMLRKDQGCLDLSFSTISAYGANAAMCHYHAEKESCAELKPKGLYLVDSGGQYYEGTTDITRTVALGPVSDEERKHFTLVAMSMLRLGGVKFMHGCRGLNLDYVAREPLWREGLNFDHGTGHGIGYLLNVHERPNGIRWKMVPERQDSCVIEPGMICSDEPGIYIEGSHGIRTENLILCVEDEENAFGKFLKFEYLTYVPIDLDVIDKDLMDKRDIELLNAYHKAVYEKIAPYLTEEEAQWLKVNTREI